MPASPDQMDNDREWFEANSDRRLRLRDPFVGELAELMWAESHIRPHSYFTDFLLTAQREGSRVLILVKQIEPGARVRKMQALTHAHLGTLGITLNESTDGLTDQGIEALVPNVRELPDQVPDQKPVFVHPHRVYRSN